MPTIRANGVTLHYEIGGPEGAPALVFSNSLGTTAAMWDAQWAALTGRFRCLRYDTRGHGRSETVDAPLSLDDLASDLAGLMDALGIEKAHVVGLSLGGMTGQALAAVHPERVDRLVLCATAAYLPPASAWQERAATVRARGMAAISGTVIERWFTPAGRNAPGAERTLAEFERTDPAGYARCCEAIAAMDLRSRIPTITAPTLVVAGAEDPATPPALSEEIARLVPGARMIAIPHAAHLIAVEQPEAMTRAISDFLAPGAATADTRRPTPAPTPDPEALASGTANRKAVLGAAHVERSMAAAGAFATPWQEFITRYAWGEIWGDDTLPWKTRSLITLSITLALGREEEFKLHLRPAMRNGVTVDELRAFLKQAAIYAGVPAANGAFRWAREVLGDELP